MPQITLSQGKEIAMFKKLDLSQFSFEQGRANEITNIQALSAGDKKRMLYAGIDVNAKSSGLFMQMNHAGSHCSAHQEGLEIMDIKAALAKYNGLPEYFWKALDKDKDEYTKLAHEHLHGGYFIRVRKGVKIAEPVQTCLFIKSSGLGQNVHNITVVEEGAEVHIISGCATSEDTRKAAHFGISEYYVEKGGKLTFTMIHNWGEDTAVRPRSAGFVGEDASFVSNYILLEKVADLQMYPSLTLNGRGGVARFNSVIVAPTGSYIDTGNRLILDAPNTKGEIIARTLTTGGTIINRSFIGAHHVPAKGHLECKGLILGSGRIHAIPEIEGTLDGVELSHEAAVGKIAQEEIEYLMARGLDEDQATSTIVRGFLNVDIMGMPKALHKAMEDEIAKLNAGSVM